MLRRVNYDRNPDVGTRHKWPDGPLGSRDELAVVCEATYPHLQRGSAHKFVAGVSGSCGELLARHQAFIEELSCVLRLSASLCDGMHADAVGRSSSRGVLRGGRPVMEGSAPREEGGQVDECE